MIGERVVVLGAGGWIANVIINGLCKVDEVVLISRSNISASDNIRVHHVEGYGETELLDIVRTFSPSKKTTIIICNGIADSAVFYAIEASEIDKVIAANLSIPLTATHVILNSLLTGELRFIYLSSTRAELGDPGVVLYSATKAALTASVKSLSLEYGRLKRYFFVLSLGLTEGGLLHKISENKSRELLKRAAIRDYVKPNDINRAIDYLRSNRAMSGSVLYCDNGYH